MNGIILIVPASLCGVYHVVSRRKVVYVGQTLNVHGRLGSLLVQPRFKRLLIDYVEFFPCEVDQLDALEEEHIRQHQPRLNALGVIKPYRKRVWPMDCDKGELAQKHQRGEPEPRLSAPPA